MDRRGFLASLIATAALDPEKLLWIPGQRTIFVPKAEIKLATPEEVLTYTDYSGMAFHMVYDTTGVTYDPQRIVDRSMSPFWKVYYLRKQGLAS